MGARDEELARLKHDLARATEERDFRRTLPRGTERYTVIQRCRNEYSVRLMCHCLRRLPVAMTPGRVVIQARVLKGVRIWRGAIGRSTRTVVV